MPYIRKRYLGTDSCFDSIDSSVALNTQEAVEIPNLSGNSFRFDNSQGHAKIISIILEDLLTDAGISFSKINDYTFNIWGIHFSLLHLRYSHTSASDYSQTNAITLIPYGQANIPEEDQWPKATSYNSARAKYWSLGGSTYCATPNATDTKDKIDTYGYLYYNDSCICFEMRSHGEYCGYKIPVFYLFKGKTILDENVAILGSTPCRWFNKAMTSSLSSYITISGSSSIFFNSRSMLLI